MHCPPVAFAFTRNPPPCCLLVHSPRPICGPVSILQTDTPAFVSGEHIVIFDPLRKHLPSVDGKRPGGLMWTLGVFLLLHSARGSHR